MPGARRSLCQIGFLADITWFRPKIIWSRWFFGQNGRLPDTRIIFADQADRRTFYSMWFLLKFVLVWIRHENVTSRTTRDESLARSTWMDEPLPSTRPNSSVSAPCHSKQTTAASSSKAICAEVFSIVDKEIAALRHVLNGGKSLIDALQRNTKHKTRAQNNEIAPACHHAVQCLTIIHRHAPCLHGRQSIRYAPGATTVLLLVGRNYGLHWLYEHAS